MSEFEEKMFDVGDPKLDKFEAMINENTSYVLKSIDERVTNPEQKQKLIQAIFKGRPENTIQKLFDISDELKIDELKRTDPTFSPQSSFVRGVDDSVTLGIASKALDYATDNADRTRLLQKAYPGSFKGGEYTGFIGILNPFRKAATTATEAALSKGALGLFEMSTLSRKAIGEYAKKYAEKRGAAGLGKVVEKTLLSNGFMTRAVDLGLGSAAYDVAKEAVRITDDQIKGIPTGDVDERLTTAAKRGAVTGAVMSLGFDAAGGALKYGWNTAGKLFQKGAAVESGVNAKYISEHLDTIQDVVKNSPESVIAVAAKEVMEKAKKFEGKLATREEQIRAVMEEEMAGFQSKITAEKERMRETLTSEFNAQKAGLNKALENTGVNLTKNIKEISKAEAQNVAFEAKAMYEEVGKGFRGINNEFRQGLEEAVSNAEAKGINPRIETLPIINRIESLLKSKGAMDASGKPLGESVFARENGALYSDLVQRWETLGGETVRKGGDAGTMSIRDALTMKKGISELANFGQNATFPEAVYRNLYTGMKEQTEKALPELTKINEKFAGKRAKLDEFRNVIGKTEIRVANFIGGLEKDTGSNVLMGETFRALGEVNPDLALRVEQAGTLKENLQILNQFQKSPRTVVNEVRNAYLKNDPILITKLEALADTYPKVRPYLEKAKSQADMVLGLSDASAVQKAVNDINFETRLASQRPDLTPYVDELKVISEQRKAFNETFPTRPRALEKRLGASDFGSTGAEKEQIANLTGFDPSAAKPLERAQVAGKVGEAMNAPTQKTLIEDLVPLGLGSSFYKLRNAMTPKGAAFYRNLAKASPQTKERIFGAVLNMIQGVAEKIPGKENLSKDKVLQLAKILGTEQALTIYGQNGGEDDLIQALQNLSGDITFLTNENESGKHYFPKDEEINNLRFVK